MSKPYVRVSLESDAKIPEYQTVGASGCDLVANEDGRIWSGSSMLVKTGLYLEIPQGMEGQIRSRSGLALNYGVTVLNSPGTIDSDYRGEVKVLLRNSSAKPFDFKKGDRIAQLVFSRVEQVEFRVTELEKLANTERADGGFGSTKI
jgi:dUTP pyrophosphatase